MHSFTVSPDRVVGLALLAMLCGCATTTGPLPKAPLPAATAAEAPKEEKTAPDEVIAVPAPEQALPAQAEPAQAEADICQQPRTCTTFEEYAAYLRACPSTPDRQHLLSSVVRLLEEQKGSDHEYLKFTQEFQDALPLLPPARRLALVGPDGLRVHDCLEFLQNGMEAGELLAKIRAQNSRYRDFTFEEIELLKQMGLTSSIIQAMIESTITAEREAEKTQRKGAAVGAAAGSQAVYEGSYAGSAGQQQYQAPPAGTGGTGAGVQDAVTNCAAQAVALEACKQLSGFAQSLCNATAKARFPCQ